MTDEVAVGSTCKVERRSWGRLDAAYEARVVRVTAKRAYFSGGEYFSLDDPRRVVLPRYLDTEKRVMSVSTTKAAG